MPSLHDSFGRPIHSLRIAVTDRCNLRCRYCMPGSGVSWLRADELLSFEEISRLARISAGLGVTKVRITGGEPLLRPELPDLVAMLAGIPALEDLALTTNGVRLAAHAADLGRAGLRRVNVSLDALDAYTFSAIARRDHLHAVRESLELLRELPLAPVKLNVVLVRGVNDCEILEFVELARTTPFIVRFIELMPLGADDRWAPDRVVPTGEVLRRIEEAGYRLVPLGNRCVQPSDRFGFRGSPGEIGFISSVTNPFCGACNRMRITADGKLRPCLFSDSETDLRHLLRSGGSDGEIAAAIRAGVASKSRGHLINRPGFVKPRRTMSQIGG